MNNKILVLGLLLLVSFLPAASFVNPPDNFSGPAKGSQAPGFSLQTLDGKSVRLSEFIGKKPVVLEFGSYTCPVFRGHHGRMEKLYAKYRDRVAFLMIYTTEAHPNKDPSPYTGKEWVTKPNKARGILYRQPTNEAERKKVASDARAELEITMPLLLDDMQDSTWNAYGRAPNSGYLIGMDGRIKLRQGWLKPKDLEKAILKELEKL